jgi:hypothetical protein
MADAFRGNANLKPAGATEQISADEYKHRIQEIVKCKRDIEYFANNYFKIMTLDHGIQQIALFQKQSELLKFFVDNNRVIVLSSRQSAKTTTYTIYCLWQMIFFPEKKILIAANKLDTSLEIISRITLALEYLPNWIKPGIVTLNKGEIELANKSGLKGFATSSSSARGYSANTIITDEFAFCQANVADSFFTSIYPVLSTSKDAKFIMVSTPNGVGNLYHNIWQEAINNQKQGAKIGWQPFRMDWWDRPGRDEAWKQQQIATIGIERFRQEFGNEFLSSSFKKLINDETIESYRKYLNSPEYKSLVPVDLIIVGQNAEYKVKIWHQFDESRTYICACDTSDGTGRDSSVIQIWDVTDYNKVYQCAAFSSNKVSVPEFAFITIKLCAHYRNPIITGECNAMGRSLFDQLQTVYEYENFTYLEKNGKPGIYSNNSKKLQACTWFQDYLSMPETHIEINDVSIIDDMTVFVRQETATGRSFSYRASGNAHDDYVMTMIWAMFTLYKDNVDKCYITAGTWTNTLGQDFPGSIHPLHDYSNTTVDTQNTYFDVVKLSNMVDALTNETVDTISNPDYKPSEEYNKLVNSEETTKDIDTENTQMLVPVQQKQTYYKQNTTPSYQPTQQQQQAALPKSDIIQRDEMIWKRINSYDECIKKSTDESLFMVDFGFMSSNDLFQDW